MGPAFRAKTEKKLFKTSFIVPVVGGRISSPFGKMRVYNGTPGWSHAGTDFAKGLGAEILAAQQGRVLLADFMSIHGNTVMIDHGWGIVSIYNHLDTLSVKEGAWVHQGQVIGTMGSTGVSTGPHLHWGISLQNERVDPMQWLKIPII